MMDIKIIKTEKEYEEALTRIDALMDAAPGSAQEEELELLTLVVEKYEEEHFPIDPPDPVEAILFRMDQQGLTAKDMIQYLGSQSKVSEVLNRKRPLSLAMIRNLHTGLGIPAEVLLQMPAGQEPGWNSLEPGKITPEIFYFNCQHLAQESTRDILLEWYSKASEKARKQKLPPFDRGRLDTSLFKELVRLGSYSAGPQMACELLNKKGIHIIVLKIQLEVELDGACFLTPEEHPVIGLTLRHNRLDDFWFSLLHLLAHLYLDQRDQPVAFFHSIDCVFNKTAPEEDRVNKLLKEAFIQPPEWRKTFQSFVKTGDTHLYDTMVQTLDVSPEILSCWWRLETEANEPLFNLKPRTINEELKVYG